MVHNKSENLLLASWTELYQLLYKARKIIDLGYCPLFNLVSKDQNKKIDFDTSVLSFFNGTTYIQVIQ